VKSKKCIRCGELKESSLDYFYRHDTHKDGMRSTCKECDKTRRKEHDVKFPEKAKALHRSYRARHQEEQKERCRIWYLEHKDRARENSRRWRKNNPEKYRAAAIRCNNKERSTAKGRLCSNISRIINLSLKGNKAGRHWEALVGYTIADLRLHLEKQFQPGMTWDNYGKWHIDHKIPRSVFNYETPEDIDFKKCFSLNNLQPLWAEDNDKKGAKLTKPFQPSLCIGV